MALAVWMVAIAGCGTEPASTGLPVTPPPPFDFTATLVDSLRGGNTECLFVMVFQATDSATPIRYDWTIDPARSTLPGVGAIDSMGGGGFLGRHEERWQWPRPSDGSALVLWVDYMVSASSRGFSRTGGLTERC